MGHKWLVLCHSLRRNMKDFVDVLNVAESKHRRINDDELDFGEILHRSVMKKEK